MNTAVRASFAAAPGKSCRVLAAGVSFLLSPWGPSEPTAKADPLASEVHLQLARRQKKESASQKTRTPSGSREVSDKQRQSPSPSAANAPPQALTQAPPPRRRPDADLPVKGLTSYYWKAGGGYQYNALSKNDPGNTNAPIADEKHQMLLDGVIGWGPIRADDLFFNMHYTYRHDWKTDRGQASQFLDSWFSTYKSEDFLFRTQDLLRSHEFAADLRYIWEPVQAGIFTRFAFGRVGSEALGAQFEESKTVVKSENFVPYIAYKYGRYYRAQFSMPFRTEINEDQPILSNKSYSFNSAGRGILFSYVLNNGFYAPQINSLVFLDLFYLNYQYASIQNDRDQLGVGLSIDFPVIDKLRAAPKLVYYVQDFVADRVRIACFRQSGNSECDDSPQLFPRQDDFISAGGHFYYDFNPNHRLTTSFTFNSTTSTIPEFNIVEYFATLTYSYSWPRTSLVQKRVLRFQENKYAEEF